MNDFDLIRKMLRKVRNEVKEKIFSWILNFASKDETLPILNKYFELYRKSRQKFQRYKNLDKNFHLKSTKFISVVDKLEVSKPSKKILKLKNPEIESVFPLHFNPHP